MTATTVERGRPMDFTGADGGLMASAFGGGWIAAWAFLKHQLLGPRIRALEEENDRCNDRVSFLEKVLYTHGSGEMREIMQLALSARDIEKRDPVAAAKMAPEPIYVPASPKQKDDQ